MFQFELNQQLAKIQASPIRSFNDQISTIEGIIKLTIGEPDFATPQLIKQAAIEAISADLNGYTHSRGLPKLRQSISNFLKRRYQLDYRPEDEIIVTVGATEALFATLLTVLNPGDKVIVPSPNYVIYGTQINLAGAEMIQIDVSQDDLYLTPERLEATIQAHPEAKVLLLNHPCNPTGITYSRQQLEQLAKVVAKYHLLVVSDEIYSELTYDAAHVSFASILPDQTILINGSSKSHAMTGWRSCFIAGPSHLINEIFKVHQAMVNTPPSQAQYASIVAYDQGDEHIELMKQAYQQRRDYLIENFNRLGFKTSNPHGAFYLFIAVPTWFKGDDVQFCLALAKEAKVGLVPGSAFGSAGQGYCRLSYAAGLSTLETAMSRIEQFTLNHSH